MSLVDKGVSSGVELDVYRILTKTFYLLDDCDQQFFKEYGLSLRQFWTLQHLHEKGACSMVELSVVLFTDKSNVTGIVDRLERLNLATRTPDSQDRRKILITLTPEGRELHDTVKAQHDAYIRQLLNVLSQDNLQSLQDNLSTLSHNLEHYLEHLETP
jgi:DNA-binding MarR family transcriptional regulator